MVRLGRAHQRLEPHVNQQQPSEGGHHKYVVPVPHLQLACPQMQLALQACCSFWDYRAIRPNDFLLLHSSALLTKIWQQEVVVLQN